MKGMHNLIKLSILDSYVQWLKFAPTHCHPSLESLQRNILRIIISK